MQRLTTRLASLCSSRNGAQQSLRRLALIPLALLAACATAPTPPGSAASASRPAPAATAVSAADVDALRTLVALQDRLYRVAAPLLVNNAELCKGNARNLLGFTAKTRYSYSSDYAAAAQSLLGLDERLRVMGVLTDSGAARAGVRRGDTLLAIENSALPQGENAERDAASVLAPMVNRRSELKLVVNRDGTDMTLNVPLTFACAFGFELGNTDNVNAYADGHRILVTRGMMNAASSDDELAFVLAKEMAHNILSHANRLRMTATVGGIIDNLIRIHPDMSTMVGTAGVKAMPADYDTVADRLSLYLVARAGYNVDGAVPFWRKFATQYPRTMLNSYTALHPSTTQRIEAMEKTLALIKSRKAAKKPLIP
jgi:beta-barrel assembly-enhancing protease